MYAVFSKTLYTQRFTTAELTPDTGSRTSCSFLHSDFLNGGTPLCVCVDGSDYRWIYGRLRLTAVPKCSATVAERMVCSSVRFKIGYNEPAGVEIRKSIKYRMEMTRDGTAQQASAE